MSVKVSSWVWHDEECEDLTGNELVLMLALADVAGDEGRCRYLDDEAAMTYAALARKVRVDRRTIIRLVARLRDRGLLVQEPGQNGRPNEFTVIVPWASRATGDTLSPVTIRGPVTSEAEPVTTETATGDKSRTHTSLIRKDVDVEPRKRGTRIPEPFMLTAEMKAWAAQEVPGLDVVAHTREFVDHWRSAAGPSSTKRDWVAAWRNWMRKALRWNPQLSQGASPDEVVGVESLNRRRDEWLARHGLTLDEYEAHAHDPEWLEQVERHAQ